MSWQTLPWPVIASTRRSVAGRKSRQPVLTLQYFRHWHPWPYLQLPVSRNVKVARCMVPCCFSFCSDSFLMSPAFILGLERPSFVLWLRLLSIPSSISPSTSSTRNASHTGRAWRDMGPVQWGWPSFHLCHCCFG